MKRIFKIIYRYKNCLKDFMLSEQFKSTVFMLGKNILEPNRLVALGTIILALFTYKSIAVSQKMVDATKRLATISQEQFKIKSYPLLFTEVSPFTIENGKTIQRIKIVNRGEIAAFRLSAMILHGFGGLDNNFRLKIMTGGTYKIKNDVIKFTYQEEYTIPSNDLHEIAYDQNSIPNYNLNDLNYLIIIMKFKVPYDDEFRYQTQIYKTVIGSSDKPKSNNTYSWARLNQKDHDQIKKIIFDKKTSTQPSTQEFLSMYGEKGNEVF